MTLLVIEKWNEDQRWASHNSWNLESFCHRISLCTQLRGTELKRVARKIKNHELNEIEVLNKEAANPLIHTLESLGAKVVFK